MECLFSVLLLPVTEAVLSHTETRSRSAVQSILSLAPRCLRGSLVPYKSEEHPFCGARLTERTVCGMLVTCNQRPKPQPQTLPLLNPLLCTVDWLTKKEPKKNHIREILNVSTCAVSSTNSKKYPQNRDFFLVHFSFKKLNISRVMCYMSCVIWQVSINFFFTLPVFAN